MYWSFHKSESFEALQTDLVKLTGLISSPGGNFPIGAVSDWKQAIALDLKNISNHKDCQDWQTRLGKWKTKYGLLLKEQTLARPDQLKRWWYTHDQNSLFVYLINNLIPKSNNSLEGINSQLDQKLGNHRGMKITQQIAFTFWYLTFGSEGNNLSKLRKLWDYWRHRGWG